MIGFVLGMAAGVILLTWHQLYLEEKEFEEELEQMEREAIAENYEPFTYDCLNDPDPVDEETSKHIPSI